MNETLQALKNKYAINLIDWYSFKNNSNHNESDTEVLVLGDCDENFLVPLSKRLKKIDVVVSSKDMLNALGYIVFKDNVKIKDKTIQDLTIKKITKKYDYVIIPALTQDIIDFFGVNKLNELIDKIIDTYTDKGKCILALDNSLSLDVIEGAKIDMEYKSYSYEDIISTKMALSEKYSKSSFKLFFPMPEYKFPIRIYSERYLPTLDDEDQRTRNLVNLGKYKEYATSYIVIFESQIAEHNLDEYSTIYVKYNIDRKSQYAIRTSIVENDKNERKVIKRALTEEANEHILKIEERANIINNPNVEILKPMKMVKPKDATDGLAYVEFEYIDGNLLSYIIIDKIKSGANVVELLNEWMDKLIGKSEGMIENFNLDCTFSNAISKDDKIYVIDTEWADTNKTEVNFLRYRILKYFYKSYSQYLNFNSFREFIKEFKFSKRDADRYEEAENQFQQLVNIDTNDLLIDKYYENKPDISKFYTMKFEYERLKSKFDEFSGDDDIYNALLGQNNAIRLDHVHIVNLETIIEDMKKEHKKMEGLVDYYHKREAIIFKVFGKLKKLSEKILPRETIRRKIVKYIYNTIRHPLNMLKMFFTKDGRRRIFNDFMIGDAYFEQGSDTIPYTDKPLVSIIIPCYNQVKYTFKCLYSIIKNTDPNVTPYEVIIADDVSTDATKNIKKYIKNIIVSRNETNLGFLKNCNKAASIARGDYIYFLNNDTEVKENYLSSLVNLIESDFSIGMVGSKLVYPNGVLQEAGGIIWSDGSGANFGRNDDPTKPQYNYVKEVDYISGCSIMIRKSLWDDIGGFDERYTPAYCEDSDLAFEVRKRGMKVMYQPLSEVVHYEGMSNGTDTSDNTSIKSYQVVNNQKLKDKWQDQLLFQFPFKDGVNTFKARERCIDKKTILFVDHYVPTWDKDAGSRTVFAYIRLFLQKGYIVKFLGDNFSLNSPYGEVLQQMGVEVLYGNDLQTNIFNYLYDNRRNFDFIFLNRPHIAINYIDFIRKNMTAKIMYYGHDLHYVRLKREYEIDKDQNILFQSKYFKSIEYSIMKKADISYFPSEVEVEEVKNTVDSIRVKALKAYIYDNVALDKKDWSNTVDLLFVGGFLHLPNVDAIRWFDEAIYPRIKARGLNVRLNIVGSNPPDYIKELANKEQYKLYGYVSDEELDRLYKTCRMVIAPIRYGAGIKGKIIEAMQKGCAIVTTPCGAEGIQNAKDFMFVEENAQEFAHAIVKNYENFEELHKLSYYARKEINKNFSADAAWDVIKEDFK